MIARLDRLAHNLAFISNLMQSGVQFVAVEVPQTKGFVLHHLHLALRRAVQNSQCRLPVDYESLFEHMRVLLRSSLRNFIQAMGGQLYDNIL